MNRNIQSLLWGCDFRNNKTLDRLDCEVLLAEVLGVTRTFLYTWPEKEVLHSDVQRFESLLSRRISGEPLAYCVGHKEFWSLPFQVTKDVLIPRRETELLVTETLEKLPSKAASVLELGTGSGAIALALAKERPNWNIIATDNSPLALRMAKHNAKNLKIDSVEFCESDWFAEFSKKPWLNSSFHSIVSNPPYIAANDLHLAEDGIRFEPEQALVSGEDGLEDIRKIIFSAPNYLTIGGWLLLEHGYQQGIEVVLLMRARGFVEIQTVCDLAGIHRVTLGRKLKNL